MAAAPTAVLRGARRGPRALWRDNESSPRQPCVSPRGSRRHTLARATACLAAPARPELLPASPTTIHAEATAPVRAQ